MEFSERLKYLRDKRGYKQIDVAKKVGIKNNTLSSYESGTRQPDYDILIKLADLYEVSLEYLLKGIERKYPDKDVYCFDVEGLNESEINDIIRHIDYVRWRSQQDRLNGK